MINDPQTLDEKMQNIQELVHQHVPDLPVKWFNGTRVLGRCCVKTDENGKKSAYQILISRPMARVNSWATIKGIVLHEIAHALVPGSGHNDLWKAMCEHIGARPEQYASATDKPIPGFDHYVVVPPKSPKKRNFAKTPPVYRYLSVCEKCGKLDGYYSKKISSSRIHAYCGGNLILIPNPLFGTENYDADRLFAELKEKIVPVLSDSENVLGIAKPKDNGDYFYILCKKSPSEEERIETYKQFEGLYEHCQLSDNDYDGPGIMDRITVKMHHHVLFPIYVTKAELWMHFESVFDQETGPKEPDFTLKSIENMFCLEVLTETDGCWNKLVEKANAGPNYVFKKWCKHELGQTIEYSEHYGPEYEGVSYPQLPAFEHLIAATYYLNRKLLPRKRYFHTPEDFDVFEKKPADLGKRYFELHQLLLKRGYASRIEKEFKKLVEEIKELLKDM